MRSLRFRYWNRTSSTMHQWAEMTRLNKIHLISKQSYRYPVMQFTGMQDSEGVDIYEGDIVEMKDSLEFSDAFGDPYFEVVTFERGAFQNTYHFYGLSVVGNIYENPELLNEN